MNSPKKMIKHSDMDPVKLRQLIRHGNLLFGGHLKRKIYGQLNCGSGKRMKEQNRVFFVSELEALTFGFRPCGHCMRTNYLKWTYSKTNRTKL